MVFGIENYMPDVIRDINYNLPHENIQWVFYSVVVLIILYLLRPKPNDKTVPSIMFFIKEGGKSKQNAFLQRFINNLLFFIQLLALLMICFALLEPFIMVQKDFVTENTAIVLDISASISEEAMQQAKELAKKNLNGDISIVLVAKTPYVALEKGSRNEARKIIDALEPKPFESSIGESIRIASDIIGDAEGKIIVLSDFMNNVGPKPKIEKEKAQAKGLLVDFINIAKPKSNVGIINIKVEKPNSLCYVKNFDYEQRTVQIDINGIKKTITIPKRSIHIESFSLIPGINKISIDHEDDISYDNIAYISTPEDDSIPVLYITNDKDDFLISALEASGFEVSVSEPPVVLDIYHKIIIMDEVMNGKILPGTVDKINKMISEGSSLIMMAHDNMGEFPELIPVFPGRFFDDKKQIELKEKNTLTKDIIFGSSLGFYNVSGKEDYISIAEVDGVSVLGMRQKDRGYLFYYGIMEDDNFRLSPSYPIFWYNLLKFLSDSKELDYYNHRTGDVFKVNDVMITPDGEKITGNFVFDDVGIYQIDDEKLAVNFLNEDESDIFSDIEAGTSVETQINEAEKKEVSQTLVIYAIIIFIILLIIELSYMKYRGDI